MDSRKILGLILLPLLGVAVWLLFSAVAAPEPPVDFSKSGNLAMNSPGLKPDVWHLMYEEPGKPGLSVELSFDEKSLCGTVDAMEPCNLAFDQGQRVHVTGITENSLVHVETLTFDEAAGQRVQLYYYDASKDTGANGAVLCSARGVVAVERTIPQTETPLADAVRLLLRGEISEPERASGITTEFPLAGLALESASIENGTATLTFADPQNKTSGGACRVSILRAQIEATAKQFPSVQSVNIEPEELFQP